MASLNLCITGSSFNSDLYKMKLKTQLSSSYLTASVGINIHLDPSMNTSLKRNVCNYEGEPILCKLSRKGHLNIIWNRSNSGSLYNIISRANYLTVFNRQIKIYGFVSFLSILNINF